MSLYNMLFGVNPLTPLLKEMLFLDKVGMEDFPDELSWTSEDGKKYFDFELVVNGDSKAVKVWKRWKDQLILKECYPTGRFRDIYYDKTEGIVVLYTRNGGGNREYYQYVFDLLSKHPNYLRDYDDDYDCTYAYIEFSVPELYKKFLNDLVTETKIESVSDKFNRLCTEMHSMDPEDFKKDKRFSGVLEVLNAIQKSVTESKDE